MTLLTVEIYSYMANLSSSVMLDSAIFICHLFDFLRLVRSEEDDMDTSWEQRLVKRFYDKLLKSILCEWMLFNGLNSIVTPTSEIHFNIP